MTSFFEWITLGGGAANSIMAIVALIGGLSAYFYRRMRVVAREEVSKMSAAQSASSTRMQHVETEVTGLKDTLKSLSAQHVDLGHRVGAVERAMDGVARAEDVHQLRAEFSEHRGGMDQAIQSLQNMVHTLYEAAMEQSGK